MSFKKQLEENKVPAIKIIADYLLTRDDLKEKLDNPKKSLSEMFKYILSEAKKQAENGCACIDNEIVFGWAVHYYDEEKVEIISDIEAQVSTSKPEEKPKEKTVEQNGRKKKSTEDTKKKKVSDIAEGQVSLF